MYCTHTQRADAGRAARPRPASLPARGLNGGLSASTTQAAASILAAGSAGQDVVRGHPVGITAGSGGQGRSEIVSDPICLCLTPFVFPFVFER